MGIKLVLTLVKHLQCQIEVANKAVLKGLNRHLDDANKFWFVDLVLELAQPNQIFKQVIW